jgi:hypothetical protein
MGEAHVVMVEINDAVGLGGRGGRQKNAEKYDCKTEFHCSSSVVPASGSRTSLGLMPTLARLRVCRQPFLICQRRGKRQYRPILIPFVSIPVDKNREVAAIAEFFTSRGAIPRERDPRGISVLAGVSVC